jgi:hypothetical protein
MCLRRAPEKYIAGAALDRAGLHSRLTDGTRVGHVLLQQCVRLMFLPQEEMIIARQQESDIFCSRELNFAIKVNGDSCVRVGWGGCSFSGSKKSEREGVGLNPPLPEWLPCSGHC